jgi:hypothetical protein
MDSTVLGVVKDGLIVPDSPLPEGVRVEIRLCPSSPEVTPELEAELKAWQLASANAVELVERLAQESTINEKG